MQKDRYLFRGQKVDAKEWVYGYYMFHETKNKHVILTKESKFIEVIPETIGQFTGILDKNGVEIYEGDFLEGFKYPVTFEDGCFCATIQYDLVRCWLNSENCKLENLEVIGNAHYNTELL